MRHKDVIRGGDAISRVVEKRWSSLNVCVEHSEEMFAGKISEQVTIEIFLPGSDWANALSQLLFIH